MYDIIIEMKTEMSIGFSCFPDAIVVTDASSRVLLANQSMTRITGLKRGMVVGHKMSDLLKDKIVSDSAVVKVIAGGAACTLRTQTIAGKENLNTARPVFGGRGNLKWIVCGIKDMTELSTGPVMHSGVVQTADLKGTTIIAESSKMQDVVRLSNFIARADSNVIIHGETGVGKELIARFIYERSGRGQRGGPFVKVNCAAIPAGLFESEVFGYDRGAFTGALSTGRQGLIETADKGVLFLDEIGDLPLELQAKLLHVIEDRQVMRVGGRAPKNIDVRIIAATNQDLRKLVGSGKFRQDLYYRISVVPIHIPALRERIEDVRALTAYYLNKLSQSFGFVKTLNSDLYGFLYSYQWPGNVRELANLLEYLFVSTHTSLLRTEDLPCEYDDSSFAERPLEEPQGPADPKEFRPLRDIIKEYELAIIMGVLKRSSCYEEAAKQLGISSATFNRRLREARKTRRSPLNLP